MKLAAKKDMPKCHLADVKEAFRKHFYMEDDRIIDVGFGFYIANLLDTDPLWGMFIGAPSYMKTEFLRIFDGYPDAYFISVFTPNTLISGKKVGRGKPAPSLLPKLNDKLLVIKDFTTILSMRHESRAEILAQLRECYDGHFVKEYGTGDRIEWHGKFGLIGACTPVYDKHSAVIGTMGERLLLFRLPVVNNAEMGQQAQKMFGRENQIRAEIREISHGYLDQFKNLDDVNMNPNPEINLMIVALGCFISIGRCPVDRDRHDQHLHYCPQPEGTPRVIKQLMQLGTGIAIAQGKNEIDAEVYEILKSVARDQLPMHRLMVLRYLWDEEVFEYNSTTMKISEVGTGTNIPIQTARLILEDLAAVGALNFYRDGDKSNSPYIYQIKDEMSKWIGGGEIFE
jgi:hypothetical protein